MTPLAYSTHCNIITLRDAITDSPVYRASTLHFDKQLNAFGEWIIDLVQHTKIYAEKLKQLNVETIALTAKLNPTSVVNNQLLDSKIVDMAANNFEDALKTNLTFKMKTVSDLEDKFTGPIEKFVDEQIRIFKVFRKQHEHALMEYESALANYATLSNCGKDSTATIHATTQRLHSTRERYIKMSVEHISRIAKLRHDLEHTLMEQYSATTSSRKDFYNNAQVWKQLNTMLFSWAKWLAEDKRTYQVETRNQHLAQQNLEKEYLDAMQLTHEPTAKNTMTPNTHFTKSGYLMTKSVKDAASPWKRQWFFIHGGYFGSCKLTDPEISATITLDDCVPLRLCQFKCLDSPDRRFCFQLTSTQYPQKSYFILQAETERDLQDWTLALTQQSRDIPTLKTDTSVRNRPSSITINTTHDPNHNYSQSRSPTALITKSKLTTVVSTPTDVPVTLSTNSDISISNSSPGSTMFSHLSASPHSASTSPVTFKITSSLDRQHNMQLATAPSLTPLLLNEITNGLLQQPESMGNNKPTDHIQSWGTPRTIFPSSQRETLHINVNHEENYHKSLHGKVVWPISHNSCQSIVMPDLPGYTDYHRDKNNELRILFNGVSFQEVVLDVFTASFLKKQNDMTMGNFYWGYAYVTQDTFWFYSCLSCSCITTIVLKLNNIKDIQVAQDTELVIHLIDTGDIDGAPSPLVFSVMLDDAELVADKLRFLMYNAKLTDPMQLRNVYKKVTAMSSTQSPSSSPASSISTFDSLSDDPPYLPSPHDNSPQPSPTARITTSNTTTTIDTTATLVTPLTYDKHPTPPTPKKQPLVKKKKVITKPFVDPDALPEHIIKPSGPLECNCDDHLDRRDAEIELPISAKRLYELMFSDESTAPPTNGGVWNSKTEGIDGHDLRVSIWEPITSSDDQDGKMKRILKYWMPVANPVVRMKEAEVVETQILLRKEDYLCYVVQISTKTEALPFADAFIPSVRYCITYMDDSRCKLTCHLGVKWTKWVMAKIIVTKAALAGMSDSVNIFVPILKEAANTVQLAVENIRQSGRDLNQTIYEPEDGSDDDDGVFEVDDCYGLDERNQLDKTVAPSAPGIENVSVKSTTTQLQKQRHLNNTQTSDLVLQPVISANAHNDNQVSNINNSIYPTHARTELRTIPTNPATTTMAPLVSESSPKAKAKTTATKTRHRLVKEKLTDASGQEAPSLVEAARDSIWPPGLWTFCTLAIGCLLYFVCISISRNSAIKHQESAIQTQVVSHAVYLRDLNDGFINKSLRPPYFESAHYTRFLQTRQDEKEYTWYASQHYRLALEYKSSREQLGIQRHNIITAFQALNTADIDLLEIEYLNWLLDNRQRCRDEQLQQQHLALEYNVTSSMIMCDEINTQIGTYF